MHLGDASSSNPARYGQIRELFLKEDGLISKRDMVKEMAL